MLNEGLCLSQQAPPLSSPFGSCTLPGMIITIDGPAGVGKSTASRRLAEALGIACLDTGATYRAATYRAMELGIDLSDEHALADVARKCDLEIACGIDGTTVLISGRDVSGAIRTPQVTAETRHAAGSPLVRGVLVELQRKLGRQLGSFVAEGRDQGSAVFPDADIKFYLDASPEVRARRRTDELLAAGGQADYDEILEAIIERDRSDRSREVAPLIKPDAAIVIDTSGMNLSEVTEALVSAVRDRT